MNEPTLDVLAGRVEQLERAARWLRLSLVGVLLFVTLGSVLVARAASKGMNASEFVLVDATGRERGAFWIFGDMPTFTIQDKRGVPRVQLDLLPDESPRLYLADADRHIRVKLKLTADGMPLLEMLDRAGKVIWKAP